MAHTKIIRAGPPQKFIEVPREGPPQIAFVKLDTPFFIYRDPKSSIYRLIHIVRVKDLKTYY